MMDGALPEDGILITCEIDPEAADLAREYFEKSPHGHNVELRLAPALGTMRSLEGGLDLVFIDAEKTEYVDYYERALELLSPKGIIVIGNALWNGGVLNPDTDRAIAGLNALIREDPRVRHVLLPVRDGVMLVRRA